MQRSRVVSLAIGLEISHGDSGSRRAQALEAEALGCDSIWLEARPGEDVFAALAELAAASARVRLCGFDPGLADRHPLVSARAIAELDRISAGRAEIGVRDEGGPALVEAITLCKKLWCDPSVEHRGARFALEETALELRPQQRPWPPLLLAGESEATLARAARMADGWLAVGHTPASIGASLALLRAGRVRAETHDGRFRVSARAEPSDRGELASWREAGVDRLIVSLAALRRLSREKA